MRSTAEDPGEGPSTATQATSTSTQNVSDPRPTTHVEAPSVPTPAQATAPHNRDMQAHTADLETQIKVLRRIQELQQEKDQLLKQLQLSESQGATPSESSHPRTTHESSETHPDREGSVSASEEDVKMKHIIIFTLTFSVQRRSLWLSDLRRAFRSSKKRFSSTTKRILYALDHMDESCRQRWDQHLRENPKEEEVLMHDWDRFEEWTLTLLKDSQHRDTHFRSQLESARQGEHQTPWEFHNYLTTLEDQFQRLPEAERALAFHAKLRPELRRHIELYGGKRPTTRLEMVNMAQTYWETLNPLKSKKHSRSDSSKSQDQSNKVHRTRRRGQGSTPSSASASKDAKSHKGDREKSESKPTNPKTTMGRILRCYECDSDTHLRNNCPQLEAKKATTQAITAGSRNTKKQQGKEKAT